MSTSLQNDLYSPGVHFLEVRHDPDCPTIHTQNEADCICKPEIVQMAESTWVRNVVETRKQRRSAERAASEALRHTKGGV